MGNGNTDLLQDISVVDSGELARKGDTLWVYRGMLADGSERPARFITIAPDTDTEAVAPEFTRTAGQWRNASTHPNIVSVYEQGDQPRPWVAVEDPPGERLGAVQPELTLREAASVVSDAAEAVRNAALYNTSHLNLSPATVWVAGGREGPRGLVDDWGLERVVRTTAGKPMAAPYTPPELHNGEAPGDERADVYGLGAVAYYGLTGEPPARESGGTADGPSARVVPPSNLVDDLSRAIDDVIVQALSTDPRDRQESAYNFRQAFDRVAESEFPEPNRTGSDRYAMSWTDSGSGTASTGPTGQQRDQPEGDTATSGETSTEDDRPAATERSGQQETSRGGLPTPVVGLFGGALAFCLSFVGTAALLFYESAANAEVLASTPDDLLLRIGWLTYNAHQVPIEVGAERGAGQNLLSAAYGSAVGSTTVPELAYYLLPGAILLVVGYAVGRRVTPRRYTPGRGAMAGASLGIGYGLLASIGAASVFNFTSLGTPVGPPLATTVLMMGIVYPLIAAGFGGVLGGR